MPAAEGMAGLAKGLAILELFGEAAPKLAISDAARLTGLNRAVARRCLLTLVDLGYLTHDGKHFLPTPRLLRLGDAYVESTALPQLAQPHLAAVREHVQESASLAVLQNDDALFIARSEVKRIVNTGVRIGASVPAYTSATGHVLLSALSTEDFTAYLDRSEFHPRTPKTPVTPDEIRRRVDLVREQGAAFTDEELEYGLRSLAVPVFDSRGRTVAAMSVSATAGRISMDQLRDEFLPVLRDQAEQLGRKL
ncbi:IclR family transcriptional regulator C-terminal domain-containing protein [Amycolatopsis carbonis]|uniref:IclR family transcriptional regulator C-terminal domain-containing protein n=1 Tax=Amycolatopsis carbonis TaxID=715471 RepID=A0A9Y2INK7_9PSEU|nr:IclR family transcriptional regulator C-terminal domain-containing protein [Amycolatopsis sp. 2-15]WIX83117.1 IclR family transcriptional regulator C-terminal domain-containing protein [Amycolatopsis sp. 2-15]